MFFKGFNKIRKVVKSAVKGNFGNVFFTVGKTLTGTFDAVKVKIIDWGAVNHFFEIAAKIFRRHTRFICKFRKRYRASVVCVNKPQ